jgi:simple sugar transport system permease protein
MLTDFLSFLGIVTPMLFASLAVITGLRAGLFNIGVSGQMLLAGFLATALVGYSPLPAYIARPLVIIIGFVCGALLGALVGWLKWKFNIHEVVSTIMFNYIISYVTGFLINMNYTDAVTRSSKTVNPDALLTLTNIEAWGLRLTIPLGLLLAFVAVFILRIVFNRTTLGFEMKAVGASRPAARYAGISEGRTIVLAMFISGALAGLAGVTLYLGYYNTIIPKELSNIGYDSIAVALLAGLDPVGGVWASALVTVFQKGAVYLSSQVKAPIEIASVITGILLFFSACSVYIQGLIGGRYGRDIH